LFLRLGVEKTGRHIANDSDKTADGIDDKISTVDDTVLDSTWQDFVTKVMDDTEKLSRPMASEFGHLTRDQPRQTCVEWLSPPDPTVNYNIARDNHHNGTALWFTENSTFRDWKKIGSLLWIYGKRTFLRSLHPRSS
jgi:hypothetical protein